MSDQLEPSVLPPRPRARKSILIAGIVIGSVAALAMLLFVIKSLGAEGY
jgi:uncharacterized membrane protein YccC